MKKTKEQILAEIAALKALKPTGRFASKTAETIRVQIEELEHGVDDTADEYFEMLDEDQMAVIDARNWKNGDDDQAPSESYSGLVG